MAQNHFPKFVLKNYEIKEWRHGIAILRHEFPEEWNDLIEVLTKFRLLRSYIVEPGKNKSRLSKWIDAELIEKRGWAERKFYTAIKVDDIERASPTHSVDCFKNRTALELEWNNKDPFFDRDLNNFRLLFDLRVISVGVILTRADELQQLIHEVGGKERAASYGNSTTHWSKLLPRIEGGGGGGCPIIALGIRRSLYEANG
jgi:hypothetical protein